MYIIPKPKEIREEEGSFVLNHKSYLIVEKPVLESGHFPAELLLKGIKEETGLEIQLSAGEGRKGDIILGYSEEQKAQSYQLKIREDGIYIGASDGAGLMYGVQTLCQIIEQCGAMLPCMTICDEPVLMNRGYYFDQTRGRVLHLAELKKIADRMCRYKMNQLQLYVEHTYLFRDLSEMWRDQTPLTAQEILELDQYCAKRHIELVPSMASFGHLCTLLSTKSYGDLCEMEDSWKTPFSFWDRMRYHTINVSDDRSLELVKKMITEYMQLFSSNQFNICADETFSLGKGKSKALADELGVHQLYIRYVKDLCEFLVEHGKTPMFWGDILWNAPELIQELPKSTICLNWGYAPDQREHETQVMAEAGAVQYVCPGVAGWNQWANLIENSYKNISVMSGYGQKYHAIGMLNTDWGDFGHVNHPEFSIPGMIYGAAFSWNAQEPSFEELNRQISRVEYCDLTESYVDCLSQICETSVFQWREAVLYYENKYLHQELEEGEDLFRMVTSEAVESAETNVRTLYQKLTNCTLAMIKPEKKQLHLLSVTLEGIAVWNQIGLLASKKEQLAAADQQANAAQVINAALAERLENWFMEYKRLWRQIGKEGDLTHISEIVFWYADWMRGKNLFF